MQDKTPRNKQGRAHGYWEIYYCDKLWRIANYTNGLRRGYYLQMLYSDNTKIENYYAI